MRRGQASGPVTSIQTVPAPVDGKFSNRRYRIIDVKKSWRSHEIPPWPGYVLSEDGSSINMVPRQISAPQAQAKALRNR